MTQESVVVPPSLPRLLALFVVSGISMVVGLLMVLGRGFVWTIAASVVSGLVILAAVTAIIRQRPRVVITSEGFTLYKLFGEESRNWADVHGDFAVIQIGRSQAVGYKLIQGEQRWMGSSTRSLLSGYDAAISGAFTMSAEQLAELLNSQARLHGGSADDANSEPRSQAESDESDGRSGAGKR